MKRARLKLPGTRWTRARSRARSQQVRPIEMGAGLYRVESSRHGRFYSVQRDPSGRLSCTCPAGTYGWPCKHVAAVYQLGEREAQAWAQDRPWTAERSAPHDDPRSW